MWWTDVDSAILLKSDSPSNPAIPTRRAGPLDRRLARINNDKVRLRLFAREWERTCAECGYSWRVPRAIARGGIRGMSARSLGSAGPRLNPGSFATPGSFTDARRGIETRAEQMDAFRICAKCSADDFTQRPAPR